jgi:hypothetical protein
VQKQAGHMPPLHSHQLHYITAFPIPTCGHM